VPFDITTQVECFLLPGDGEEARTTFLQHLDDPHEMWIIAYAFTLQPMIDTLVKDAPDRMLHIYLDHSQASGKTELPLLQKLVDAGLEVTIGTSTAGTKFICHTKGIVCNDVPSAWCWEGSVNFSLSGWSQVNTAMLFNSQTYYDAFVNQFLNLRHFAWTQERSMQLMSKPPAGALEPPPPMGSDANSVAPGGTTAEPSHNGLVAAHAAQSHRVPAQRGRREGRR
jgi:hypothetical protein